MMKEILHKLILGSLCACAISCGLGCDRDVRLAGKRVRQVQVKSASHYGVQLDQTATPEQVAFVALRAIREDFFASDSIGREAALDIQFDVAAADVIAARNRTSLSRDDYIHHVVTHWTPAVAHYAADFETDMAKATARFKNRGVTRSTSGDTQEVELAMEVADPGHQSNARVVLLVHLAQDAGMWRVLHVGFEPKRELAGPSGHPPAQQKRT